MLRTSLNTPWKLTIRINLASELTNVGEETSGFDTEHNAHVRFKICFSFQRNLLCVFSLGWNTAISVRMCQFQISFYVSQVLQSPSCRDIFTFINNFQCSHSFSILLKQPFEILINSSVIQMASDRSAVTFSLFETF